MSTGVLLAPGALLYSLNFQYLNNDFTIPVLVTFQIFALAGKIIFPKDLDASSCLKYLNAHAWKALLDSPTIRSMQKKQDAVMVKIRTGVIDEEVLSTYAEYKFNSEKLAAWRGNIYYHQTPRNYRGDVEDSPQSQAMKFRFEEIIEAVERVVSKDVLEALIKPNSVHSLSFKQFDAEKIQKILPNYGLLKEIDYKEFEQLVKEHHIRCKDIVELLAKNPEVADWPRIKNILVHHYRRADYDEVARIVDSIVPNSTQILLPQFPAFKDWPLIQKHYQYITINKERLDGNTYSQYAKDVEFTAELLSSVSKTLKDMSTDNASSTRELIDDTLSELLQKSITIKNDIEASVIKDLSVHRKHLKTFK